MKTIMLVFGTRPEAIKMCPLVKEFQKHKEDFKTIVCVTGQHREMLDQVLTIFDVRPDFDLNIMKQGQDLYDVTARVLTGMRDVFKKCKPDVVLVHGDTTTSTAAALAAFTNRYPWGISKPAYARTTSTRHGLKKSTGKSQGVSQPITSRPHRSPSTTCRKKRCRARYM